MGALIQNNAILIILYQDFRWNLCIQEDLLILRHIHSIYQPVLILRIKDPRSVTMNSIRYIKILSIPRQIFIMFMVYAILCQQALYSLTNT